MTNLLKSNMFVYITNTHEPSMVLEKHTHLHNFVDPAKADCQVGPDDTLYVYTMAYDFEFDYNCLISVEEPGSIVMILNEPIMVVPKYTLQRGVGGIYGLKPILGSEPLDEKGTWKIITHLNKEFREFRQFITASVHQATPTSTIVSVVLQFEEHDHGIPVFNSSGTVDMLLVSKLKPYLAEGTKPEPFITNGSRGVFVALDYICVLEQIAKKQNIN